MRKNRNGYGRRRECGLVVAIMVFSAYLISPVLGQESANEEKDLARRIHEAVEGISAVRAERLHLQEEHETKLTQVERQIDKLKEESEETAAALEKEEKSVKALEATEAENGKLKEKAEAFLSLAVHEAIPVAEHMAQRVREGIPYRKQERGEQVQSLLGHLRDGSLQTRADALDDYLLFSSEELRLADSIDLWNEPVLLDNGERQVHAYQIRLGLISHFFVSEDGQTMGVGSKEEGCKWNIRLRPAEHKQLLEVRDVLQERSAPDIVSVPVDAVTSSQSSEPSTDDKRSED